MNRKMGVNKPRGFTLTELLIGLAIAASIALFAVSKLAFTTNAQEFRAIAQETEQVLQDSYLTQANQLTSKQQTLIAFLSPALKLRASNTAAAPGNSVLSATHPCKTWAYGNYSQNNYIQLENNVIIMGLNNGATQVPSLTTRGICIDLNGTDGPNTWGRDVVSAGFSYTSTGDVWDWTKTQNGSTSIQALLTDSAETSNDECVEANAQAYCTGACEGNTWAFTCSEYGVTDSDPDGYSDLVHDDSDPSICWCDGDFENNIPGVTCTSVPAAIQTCN
jgi:prepilin-type N-terminal cleavage/methylation domain-containing protein